MVWSNDTPGTFVFPPGTTTGQRVVVGYDSTQNATGIFAYDSNNLLVFALENNNVLPVLTMPTTPSLGQAGSINFNDGQTTPATIGCIQSGPGANSFLELRGSSVTNANAATLLLTENTDISGITNATFQFQLGPSSKPLILYLQPNSLVGTSQVDITPNFINANENAIYINDTGDGTKSRIYINKSSITAWDDANNVILQLDPINGSKLGSGVQGKYYYEEFTSHPLSIASAATFNDIASAADPLILSHSLSDVATASMNLTNGQWTCQAGQTGIHNFSFSVAFQGWTAGSRLLAAIFHTATATANEIAKRDTADNAGMATLSIRKYITAGDIVYFRVGQVTGSNQLITDGSAGDMRTMISIFREPL